MTRTCVLCKKQHIPDDKSRSFHKFQIDKILKEKWMQVIGVVSIKESYSAVCSDHFDPAVYHQTDGYTHLKRLLPNALPLCISPCNKMQESLNAIPSLCSNNLNNEVNIPGELTTNKEIINSNIEMNISDSALGNATTNISNETVEHNAVKDLRINSSKLSENSKQHNIQNSISNRKRPLKLIKNTIPTKKFRLMNGYQTKHIIRKHFSSDEAWNDFLGFLAYKNGQNSNNNRQSWRMRKRISIFKDLVKSIREEKALEAAQYIKFI